MMDVKELFGRRLNQARLIKGISMEELGKQVHPQISRQAINKYEKGETMPDSGMLIALAGVLEVKPDFFFRPFTVAVDNIFFHKKSRLSEKSIVSIREKVREELERYLEVEELCGCVSAFKLSKKLVDNEQMARDYAGFVRKQLGLGVDGISSVIEILEENGLKIIEIDDNDSFSGLSGFANDNIPVIVINKNLSPENKRFTLLHELGHIVLDFKFDMGYKEMEQICNAFASEMLLPAASLISRLGCRRHDIALEELNGIQRQFGVSVNTIMESLLGNGVITSRRYDGYKKKKQLYPAFNDLVEKSVIPAEHSGRFARMVYRIVADEVISLSKAAAFLNTTVDSVQARLQLV